jgi:hypothetical protein
VKRRRKNPSTNSETTHENEDPNEDPNDPPLAPPRQVTQKRNLRKRNAEANRPSPNPIGLVINNDNQGEVRENSVTHLNTYSRINLETKPNT